MELFKKLILVETQKRAHDEVQNAIKVINAVYKEWKHKKRRKNAVDLITTSVNKVSNLNPSIIEHLHDPAKLKLTTILMRCMDNPCWKPVEAKQKIYRKLYPLIAELQHRDPQTLTHGTLKDIIMTRLSACICYQDESKVFVAYEPKLPKKYLTYIFGAAKLPEKTFRMQSLLLPEDFETLVELLTINHEKCKERYEKNNG